MSLLNLTNDGLPNVLMVLFAAVAKARTPLSREELLELVAPPQVVPEDGKMARQTLTRWTELGLFKAEGERIVLAESPESDFRDDNELLESVRKAARKCALAPENNVDLWASESARAADLTRAMSWLLAQDVYRFKFKGIEDMALEQLSGSGLSLVQNDTRYNGLRFWAHFLGFVRQPGADDIDPTVAVRDSLSLCLPPGDGMAADLFVDRLCEVLPVLDRGTWRVAVENRLNPGSLQPLAKDQLSSSLSRALLNLMLSQEILLEQRADMGSGIALTGRDGLRADYRFQWVRRPGGRRSK